jgi:hypothetical protein
MQRIIFTTDAPSLLKLESLSKELKNLGISKFDVDFETCEISVICPHVKSIQQVECALRKAGFKCPRLK